MRRILTELIGAAFLLFAGFVVPASAGTADQHQTVGNVDIYLGIMPAKMIRGHYPAASPENRMHGGVPTGSGEYHITVALFDATTGKRINNAQVQARVADIGLGGEEKQLQLMKIANTLTYGNYFPMEGNGPFRIYVDIRLPGQPGEISARFEYEHP